LNRILNVGRLFDKVKKRGLPDYGIPPFRHFVGIVALGIGQDRQRDGEPDVVPAARLCASGVLYALGRTETRLK
jgi:hypothetical protein